MLLEEGYLILSAVAHRAKRGRGWSNNFRSSPAKHTGASVLRSNTAERGPEGEILGIMVKTQKGHSVGPDLHECDAGIQYIKWVL